MKYLLRPFTLILTIALVLGLVGTSFAQSEECFDLSPEDCELYYELLGKSEFPLSSEFNLDMELAAAIDSNTNKEAFDMGLYFSGAYIIDADAVEMAVEEFADTPVLDVSAGTFLDLARGTISAFDAELEVDYAFSDELGIPPIGPLNLWLVDGIGYVDFTPFQIFDPSLEGVYGMNLFDLIEIPLQEVRVGDLLDAFDSMAGMGASGSDPMAMNALGTGADNPFANFMPANITPDEIMSFISVERADDDSVDGHDVAVFVTTIDIGAAMELDSIVDIAYESAAQNGMPEDISKEAFAAAIADGIDGSMIITEKLDLETGTSLAVSVAFDMALDVEPFAAMTGEQEKGSMTISFTWDYELNNVNGVDAIEVPEGAQVIPVEALLGGM